MLTKISIKKALTLKNTAFVDVRTPAEFKEDHLPKAINIPVLDNKERAIVGTIYKQISRELAVQKGEKYYQEKIPKITETIKSSKNKTLIVYCWRGGMRSKILATLFHTLNYKTYQLEGGYKSYRKFVLHQLTNYQLKPKPIILHGLTCTGKTQLLKKFPNSLDLEGLAQHRGSLYGALSLKPNSQKRFESLLLQKLNQLNHEKPIFIEGESRRIGNTIIPEFLWKAMKNGINVLINKKLSLRTKDLVKEYFTEKNIKEIKEITKNLSKVISKTNKQKVIELIEQKQYQKAAEILLTKYYDPLYNHTLKKINYSFEINNNNLENAVKELKEKISTQPSPTIPSSLQN